MRIDKEEQLKGFFWLPETKDHRVPGTLTISSGGRCEIEIMGVLENDLSALQSNENIERVIGDIENYGLSSFEECFYKHDRFNNSGTPIVTVDVSLAILSVAFDYEETPTFDVLSFEVEGLEEWLLPNNDFVKYINLNENLIEIPLNRSKTYSHKLTGESGVELEIQSTCLAENHSLAASDKAIIKITSANPKELPFFTDKLQKICHFLFLGMDLTSSIKNLKGQTRISNSGVDSQKHWASIIFRSTLYSDRAPTTSSSSMLYTHPMIEDDLECLINRWIDSYDIIGPSLHLYFSVVSGRHTIIDVRFLLLTQALETFHRRTSDKTFLPEQEFLELKNNLIDSCPQEKKSWLDVKLKYANEVSLRARIKELVSPYHDLFTKKERGYMINKIVNTRNFLTHYDQDIECSAAEGSELVDLCLKMEAIFQLNLLRYIQFPERCCEHILENNINLRRKLNCS